MLDIINKLYYFIIHFTICFLDKQYNEYFEQVKKEL